jgi:predicted O-methyltransferase YrrM
MLFAELGIIDALAPHPLPTAELAHRLHVDIQALGRLLRAGNALGLVTERNGMWEATPLSLATLATASPQSLSHAIRLQSAFARRWSRLREAVQTGHKPAANQQNEDRADWVRLFTLGLYELARVVADDVAAALLPLLGKSAAPRIIDLGGGHGAYSIALVRQLPTAQAVIFDLPPVIAVTRQLVHQHPFADRLILQEGDFFVDSLGHDYDLALLFGVLNSEPEERAQYLLRRTWAALRPGGWLAIRHWDETSLDYALMDLHMLLSTDHGQMPREEELRAWLTSSGFTAFTLLPIPSLPHEMLILAQRPRA